MYTALFPGRIDPSLSYHPSPSEYSVSETPLLSSIVKLSLCTCLYIFFFMLAFNQKCAVYMSNCKYTFMQCWRSGSADPGSGSAYFYRDSDPGYAIRANLQHCLKPRFN